jgi:hypothetical protein
MCTRSKFLSPTSPAMSTRSKRRLSLWLSDGFFWCNCYFGGSFVLFGSYRFDLMHVWPCMRTTDASEPLLMLEHCELLLLLCYSGSLYMSWCILHIYMNCVRHGIKKQGWSCQIFLD